MKWGGLSTVAGGLGVVPAARADVDTTRTTPAPRPMGEREARALMHAELIQAVQGVAASATELSSRIARWGATNGVLDVSLRTIDPTGVYAVDYPVTVGSVLIVNHSAATLTVHSGAPGLSAPITGAGVQMVEAHAVLRMPIGERSFAVWGAAASVFSLQAFTGLQAYGVGSL